MKSTSMAVAALLLLGWASPAIGQEAEGGAAPRQAQPRQRAPRSEAPPPAASAPARQGRGDEGRQGTDSYGRVRAPRGAGIERGDREAARGEPRERAIHRAPVAPPPTRTEAPAEPPPPTTRSAPPARSDSDADDAQRRAVPRGSRPRGDNPAVGRAVPRDGRSYPRDGRSSPGSWSGPRVYSPRGRVYNNYYYYYPRRWYPYGYGAFGGLGYFYYDPYTWYSYDPYWSRPHHYRYYGSYRGYGDYYYDSGELRLQVRPRHAEVYVDGYFAGHVDDFDGIFQALRLEEGPYRIEIAAPGYETLVFDIRILPGRKITYRGELRPRP